jgi:hypothetical protein
MQWQSGMVSLLCLATAPFLLAQIATGVIRGTVQDSTGAVLIGAQVTLIDEAKSESGISRQMRKGSLSSRHCVGACRHGYRFEGLSYTAHILFRIVFPRGFWLRRAR